MTFSDTTNKNGLIQECERILPLNDADISGTDLTLRQFTSRINNAASIIWSKIMMANGGWEYDDGNYTDLPQSSTNLVSGTATYQLDSEAIILERVDCKDSAGNWRKLIPIHSSEIDDMGVDEFMETDGTPKYYRLTGETIELFPAPNYNSTNGLKIFFNRKGVVFQSTDTTDSPGFVSEFHYLLPVKASMDWLRDNDTRPNQIAMLNAEWLQGLQDLQNYYEERWRDQDPQLKNNKRFYNWK